MSPPSWKKVPSAWTSDFSNEKFASDYSSPKKERRDMFRSPGRERREMFKRMDVGVTKGKSVQALAMQEQYIKSQAKTATLGAIVQIPVDLRDRARCNPLGLMGVVFEVYRRKSVQLAVTHGIIGVGPGGKGKKFFPVGDVTALSNPMIRPELKLIQQLVLTNQFDVAKQK